MSKRDTALEDVQAELERHARLWSDGTLDGLCREDDKMYPTPEFWISYIIYWVGKWFPGEHGPYDPRSLLHFRKAMIYVAAAAIRSIRWADRRISEQGE